jgi:hypothetical protein
MVKIQKLKPKQNNLNKPTKPHLIPKIFWGFFVFNKIIIYLCVINKSI